MKDFLTSTVKAIYFAWVGLLAVAFAGWAGWTWLVPPDNPVKVAVTVASEVAIEINTDTLEELTAAIQDIREWAAIEVERARQ